MKPTGGKVPLTSPNFVAELATIFGSHQAFDAFDQHAE
jgi:hypothetical protein